MVVGASRLSKCFVEKHLGLRLMLTHGENRQSKTQKKKGDKIEVKMPKAYSVQLVLVLFNIHPLVILIFHTNSVRCSSRPRVT